MRFFYAFFLFCAVLPCAAQRTCATYDYTQARPVQTYNRPSEENVAGTPRDTIAGELITIPVVVHILYNNSVQNISDEQVLSQLEVLNKDYRKLNNTANIPAPFAGYAADTKISFCIAKTDPSGKATSGIVRKYTAMKSWTADDQMKFSAAGGDDGWDAKKYLNIWVVNLSGNNLGYASLPAAAPDKDGVVIQYDAFGSVGAVRYPFDKGRTATHEVGHWLGLMHLWGDALCGDDHIDDTPPQRSYNNGCPSFPHTSSCSVNAYGDMFMNFMDFSDDGCMSMFTYGQKNKMRSMFALGNPRNSFLSSTACVASQAERGTSPTGTEELGNTVSLYPNPAINVINVESANTALLSGQTIHIYAIAGYEVKSKLLVSGKNTVSINDIPAGIYLVRIGNGKEIKSMRFVKK